MSLAAMSDLVERLELRPDGHDLRQAFEIRDRLDAHIALAVAQFEAAGGHELDGAVSMNGWLRRHAGRDPQGAARVSVTGRKLQQLPVLRDAVVSGALSGGQLDTVLANVPARHLERFAHHEPELVPLLADLDVDQTRQAMQAWRHHADALDDGPAPVEHDNELHLTKTLEARSVLHGSFDADTTATITAALRVAASHDLDRSLAVRHAEGLAQICQHFLDHQHLRRGGRHRPHLNIVIHQDHGTYLDTGQPVAPDTLGVLLCDAAIHRVLTDGASTILDYGRATRTWPADLANAITTRDRGCRFPGCDTPPSWADIHHLTPWEHGGPTAIDNGALLCRRHHRLIHKPPWHLKLLPDATIEVTFPDGHTETSDPHLAATPLWRPPPDDTS